MPLRFHFKLTRYLPGLLKVYGLVKGSPEAIAKLLQEKPLDL